MSEPWAQNTLGLDYRAEAELLGDPVAPIVDVHTHINGGRAAEIWAVRAARFLSLRASGLMALGSTRLSACHAKPSIRLSEGLVRIASLIQ